MEGNLVIAGRPDLREEYLAALIEAGAPGVNPIVRILLCLRYPIQHAIYWPEVPCENAPVPAGCVCRLPFLRAATPEEAGMLKEQGPYGTCDALTARTGIEVARTPEADVRSWGYPASLAAAQREALARCENAAEREIITRHLAGDYRRRRLVRAFTPWELEQHLKHRRQRP